jgi:hypothetical protein
MASKKLKSKRNHSVVLTGLLDIDDRTITEYVNDADIVYNIDEIIRAFNGKEVSITVRETNELESV